MTKPVIEYPGGEPPTELTIDDIVVGGRFVDILTVRPDGTRLMDYRKFHDIEPQFATDGAPGTPRMSLPVDPRARP